MVARWLSCFVLLAVQGCTRGTYVALTLDPGSTTEAVTAIELDLTLGSQTATQILQEPDGRPIALPTTAMLQLQHVKAGTLSVVAIAKNAAGNEVGRSTGSVEIRPGGDCPHAAYSWS